MHVARHTLLIALVLPIAVAQQAPALQSAAQPPGKGIIRGVVTALDTGKPIRNATVFIQGADPTPMPAPRFTDAQGRYEISGLEGGQYRLSAMKPGYVSPGSVIVARITDQFGDPDSGVAVRPMLQRFQEGRRQLSGIVLIEGPDVQEA